MSDLTEVVVYSALQEDRVILHGGRFKDVLNHGATESS